MLARIFSRFGRRAKSNIDARADRISRQALRTGFARNAVEQQLRRVTVDSIRDQSELAELAERAVGSDVRIAAVRRLENDELLRRFAQDESRDVRLAAIAALRNQKILSDLARQSTDPEVRLAAVSKVDDQQLLVQLVPHDMDHRVRLAAASRVTEPSLLAQLASEAFDVEIQKAAEARLAAEPMAQAG